MKRFSLRIVGIIAGLAGLVLMTAAPAGAVTVGAGVVVGNVTINPGIDQTTRPTTYTFTPITLVGAVANTSPRACAGTITTSIVTGGSAAENLNGSTGSVNAFTFAGSNAACSVSGSASGSFTRTGPLVTVDLAATITVCTIQLGCTTEVNVPLTVVALFIPTTGNGVTAPITQATFAGVFVVGV